MSSSGYLSSYYRSSGTDVFSKKGVLKNFKTLKAKHSSGKWIRLTNSPCPPRKTNFYPKNLLNLPKKVIFQMKKFFASI